MICGPCWPLIATTSSTQVGFWCCYSNSATFILKANHNVNYIFDHEQLPNSNNSAFKINQICCCTNITFVKHILLKLSIVIYQKMSLKGMIQRIRTKKMFSTFVEDVIQKKIWLPEMIWDWQSRPEASHTGWKSPSLLYNMTEAMHKNDRHPWKHVLYSWQNSGKKEGFLIM